MFREGGQLPILILILRTDRKKNDTYVNIRYMELGSNSNIRKSMAADEIASTRADDASTFYLLLRGADGPAPSAVQGGRVVLLHGWLQSHSCWLRTAAALRDTYGHDVLLLDFWGHGHSPRPPADASAGIEGLIEQVGAHGLSTHSTRIARLVTSEFSLRHLLSSLPRPVEFSPHTC